MEVIQTKNKNLVVKDGQRVGIFSPLGKFYSARTPEFWEYLKDKGLEIQEAGNFKFPELYSVVEYRGSQAVHNTILKKIGTWEQVQEQFPEAKLGVFEYEDNSPSEGDILQYVELICSKVSWDELEGLEEALRY